MAKVKVINKGQNSDLIGGNFTNDASQTIFSLGAFSIQSNFAGRKVTKYENMISSFVTPITLENLNLNKAESESIVTLTSNVILNLDRSDLKAYSKFGSTKEIIRVAIEGIIKQFPASIFMNTKYFLAGNFTATNFVYNPLINESTFSVPKLFIDNKFGIVTAKNNFATPDDYVIRNLNLSYQNYVIWKSSDSTNNTHYVLGYTGDTPQNQFLNFRVQGNPFPELSANTASTVTLDYHIKPDPRQYNIFYASLEPLQKHLLSKRNVDDSGFMTTLKEPIPVDDGSIFYTETPFLWTTKDRYNIDIDTPQYSQYVLNLVNLGELYDKIKTDLIYRMLTTSSIKAYDQTDELKMSKLLRIYGREFDNIRQYIDAIAYANTVTYNKKNNISDTLVKNLAKTLGWNTVNLVSDDELGDAFFNQVETEEDQVKLPFEIDIELWRRIIINTNYYWKSKGTRASLKSMLRIIGIPEAFVDITEYVYTVEGKINPNTVNLTLEDIGTPSLPYDIYGYPVAPKENNDFFFQLSGDTDGGQAYIDVFRRVGFSVNRTIDNKKSWEQAGFVERQHYSSPAYFQRDSKLIINTKEIDATLDTARGIEYDVYCFNKITNYPISTTGVTKPYLYINIPFTYGVSANTFTIISGDQALGNIQVNFNGITLERNVDYIQLNSTTVQLVNEYAITHGNGSKDVITLTYMHDRYNGLTGDYSAIQYIVTTITAVPSGVEIPLPFTYTSSDSGDIQLTINGISLTKSTSLFTGDYIIAPTKDKIIVQNASLVNYLQSNPVTVISYIQQANEENLQKKFEVHRVDSFSSSKLSFNSGINKFVYNMDFEAFDINSFKVTINGITLQNGSDFTLNSGNKYQIFLPAAINFGDIIGVYYVIGSSSVSSFLPPNLSFPNISELSFLEYLELITRKLINAKTRKTITDNNGGFYPTVLKIYEEYLKLSYLPVDNFYHSNGYTFSNVFPFITKFSTFFERFITDLLPATVILKKGGTLIRNTAFTRQKFTYKRGVNFNPNVGWLGDDGSEFKVKQIETTYNWGADSVCIDNGILVIENVVVTPDTVPTTTTTTTTTTLPPPPERLIVVGRLGNTGGKIHYSEDDGASWTQAVYNTPNPSYVGNYLRGLSFFDGYTGIASGNLGTVWRTTDSGTNWTLISSSNSPALKIHPDATSVLEQAGSVGSTMYLNSGSNLFKSTDFGVTWTKPAGTVATFFPSSLHVIDSDTVVSVGDSNSPRIVRTTNGGNTITTIESGSGFAYKDVHFNGNIGIAVATNNMVKRSTNGGATWTNITTSLITNSSAQFWCVRFASSSVVYVHGYTLSPTVAERMWKSTNGGVTWTEISSGLVSINGDGCVSMAWKDVNTGWLLSSGGRVRKTTNGGVTWTAMTTIPNSSGLNDSREIVLING